MTDQEILDGYELLFDTNLRLAHEALLQWSAENEPDCWPSPAAIVRFAACYSVPVPELAGLVGILTMKVGRRTVFCDARRHPELVNRNNVARFSRASLVAYGFYNVASEMTARDQAMVH
jgi:hypothetical protein